MLNDKILIITIMKILFVILGVIAIGIGVFVISPFNNPAPYTYYIGGGLYTALVLWGLGIVLLIFGLVRK